MAGCRPSELKHNYLPTCQSKRDVILETGTLLYCSRVSWHQTHVLRMWKCSGSFFRPDVTTLGRVEGGRAILQPCLAWWILPLFFASFSLWELPLYSPSRIVTTNKQAHSDYLGKNRNFSEPLSPFPLLFLLLLLCHPVVARTLQDTCVCRIPPVSNQPRFFFPPGRMFIAKEGEEKGSKS